MSCKKGVTYSQFLRLRRICSNIDDFVRVSKMLSFYFHKADYPTEILQGAFEKPFLKDHMSLLSPKLTPNVQGEEQAEKESSPNSIRFSTM